jgi:hypothetical protein
MRCYRTQRFDGDRSEPSKAELRFASQKALRRVSNLSQGASRWNVHEPYEVEYCAIGRGYRRKGGRNHLLTGAQSSRPPDGLANAANGMSVSLHRFVIACALPAVLLAESKPVGGPLSGPAVLDAAFSAMATTTIRQTLADGTRIDRTTSARYYRHADGRVRIEQRLPGSDTSGAGPGCASRFGRRSRRGGCTGSTRRHAPRQRAR